MRNPEPLTRYRVTDHAKAQMTSRHIREEDVAHVLAGPEQVAVVRPGRYVYQSRVLLGEPPKTYLLRVFVDMDRKPPAVVTVYRTSKVMKYWRTDR
jgi:hypothetical protein